MDNLIWKFYAIETIGNLGTILSISIAVIGIILIGSLCGRVSTLGLYEDDDDVVKKIKSCIKKSIIALIIIVPISVLIPTKKFMYTSLGIKETVEFIQGNEEVKKMSSKTLQLINKKLDNFLNEE